MEGWLGRIGLLLLLLIGISRIGVMCSIVLPLVEELAIVGMIFGRRNCNMQHQRVTEHVDS